MVSRYYRIVYIIILIGGCTQSQNTNKEESIILANRELSNKAIAEKDTVALAKHWTDDYHMISSRNFEVTGLEKNRHQFAQEFNTKKEVLYVRTAKKIEINSNWDMAAESGEWTGQWVERDGMVKLAGSYYAKWHKVNGEWKIRAEIFTPTSCVGSEFCNKQPKL